MAVRSWYRGETAFLTVLLTLGSTDALGSAENPKAISVLRDATVKAIELQANDFKISDFDLNDALVGHSVPYEFRIEIDKKVLPFKLLEGINRWEYVDLPIFRTEDPSMSGHVSPVLAPFQLAWPIEVWIQDAKDLRLSLQVVLADGAVVMVKGTNQISHHHIPTKPVLFCFPRILLPELLPLLYSNPILLPVRSLLEPPLSSPFLPPLKTIRIELEYDAEN
ncbi:hypothetical protein NE237_018404 [Protea cynaroides]|uniref:Uncharacterized protein n=1 Tax=Protea cynaroides TaxID=273540 RepID=A0A9Q0QNZ2_9MAGN|nr:hypothetical protein NE237_018404 [Protea cynaroides]